MTGKRQSVNKISPCRRHRVRPQRDGALGGLQHAVDAKVLNYIPNQRAGAIVAGLPLSRMGFVRVDLGEAAADRVDGDSDQDMFTRADSMFADSFS